MAEVILVDNDDKFIGTAEKLHAHRKSLLHRAFSIFIYNDNNEILLQQRSKEKYHCGDLWTNTCCSHAILGENIKDTAKTRLQFEMNLMAELEFAGKFYYKAYLGNDMSEHEIDHVFVGKYQGENICPNPDEASNFSWTPPEYLATQLRETPEKFTPWLSQALTIALKHLHFQQK
jgi:isopentenyl-diphosphate delta-isomerase